MGMAGSRATSKKAHVLCVLGDLLQEGIVAETADDLHCGGYSW